MAILYLSFGIHSSVTTLPGRGHNLQVEGTRVAGWSSQAYASSVLLRSSVRVQPVEALRGYL